MTVGPQSYIFTQNSVTIWSQQIIIRREDIRPEIATHEMKTVVIITRMQHVSQRMDSKAQWQLLAGCVCGRSILQLRKKFGASRTPSRTLASNRFYKKEGKMASEMIRGRQWYEYDRNCLRQMKRRKKISWRRSQRCLYKERDGRLTNEWGCERKTLQLLVEGTGQWQENSVIFVTGAWYESIE